MKAIDVELKFPFYSIKHVESYQVGISYLSQMPSSLLGAIGYGLALKNKCHGEACKNEAQKIVKKAREYFVETKNPLSIKFPVILKRLRGVLESGSLPSGFDELVAYSDAMVREYVFTEKANIIFIGDLEEIKGALNIIDRLGDSESLASVTSIDEISLKECDSSEVNVLIKSSLWNNIGNHIVNVGFDENWKKSLFVFPLSDKDNKAYYSPIKINRKALCSDDEKIKIPSGDDW